jgi:hypothetical protein
MGGFGSGMGYGPKKLTLNDLPAMDAAVIKARLRKEQTFTITWDDRIRQSFRADESTLHALDLGQIIEIERTACHFGGERFWFRCPYCDSRRRKLYLSRHGMECRGCLELPYQVENETRDDRAMRRYRKFSLRHFGDDDVFSVYAPKPRWRRWRTHLRAQDERERLRWRALAPIFRYGGRV